ncbi:GNAT family N-acetyltransferase [Spongiactinospora rosea]|uniref:GNAT family N-acetyltransferase n=1 Tax=Spongiactinospora rosea TaxID=2248750 RepID=UPI001313EEB6|nr:GNAT family N-acetyltransferase [Spongiactinospora rosea]
MHRLLDTVAEVAEGVFTRPPWSEPRTEARAVAARLATDALRPGFLAVAALHGDQVCGFAYAVPCSRLALLASRLPRGDLTLKELAVLPAARGWGLGAMLHDRLLAAAPPASWWLLTHPRAGAALGLYRHRGWRVAACHPAPHGRSRLIMLREACSPSRAAGERGHAGRV